MFILCTYTHTRAHICIYASGDTVVSSIYIERYMSTETLSCIFTRAGEIQAPKIFGS